jgi:hypothetical protein
VKVRWHLLGRSVEKERGVSSFIYNVFIHFIFIYFLSHYCYYYKCFVEAVD